MSKSKLFTKNYSLLFAGLSVSQLGQGAGLIGILWWVEVTTGSALALGALAMVQTIVGVIVGPFAGAFVDRVNRKAIIVITDFIRGLVFVGLGWLAAKGQLTMGALYWAMGVNALCGQTFLPAINAMVPQLVPNSLLEKANSLNQVAAIMVNIVGYAIGGVLVAALGLPLLLLLNGIAFILSAASEMFIQLPSQSAAQGQALSVGLFIRDISEGIRYVRKNPVLSQVLQSAMILNFFIVPFFVLLPKFVNEYLGAGSKVFGYFLSAQMLGSLVAIVIMSTSSLVQRHLWLVRCSIVFQAAALFALPFIPPALWGIHMVLLAIGGMFNATVNIYFSTLIQRVAPQEFMGKIFGLVSTVSQALQPASQGLTGVVAEVVRIPIIFSVCAACVGAGGLRFATIPDLRSFLQVNADTAAMVAATKSVPD